MSKHTDTKRLCEWLRENSSGSYRNSALAADVIESLERQNAELLEAMVEYDNLLQSWEPDYLTDSDKDAMLKIWRVREAIAKAKGEA